MRDMFDDVLPKASVAAPQSVEPALFVRTGRIKLVAANPEIVGTARTIRSEGCLSIGKVPASLPAR